ncbi:phosphatase PAP2 family protein [Virgibacillus oceani]|uniref:Phosphatidylglycerophosphatase B n=1 Tax=Virgibacillus oceani TaxID=1479511 RepID=A0A917M817_9BACI|nr:phosphatase PAP2 family protein [Virgibacillus oceani]GGG83400.1 phosphatidylglycerophosphatase B [Virgibacillus oceani]
MPLSRKGKRGFLIAGTLFLMIIVVIFSFTYHDSHWSDLNTAVAVKLYNFLGDGWTSVLTSITNIGSGYFQLPLTGLLVMYFVFQRYYWVAGLVAFNIISVRLINRILKSVFEVARPNLEHLVHAGYYSFPSGHAMNSTAFYGLLAFLICSYIVKTKKQRFWTWLLVSALIVLIGFSRVYLGVHFPMDVLGGFAAGGAWLLISIFIHSFLPIKERARSEKDQIRG